MTRGRSRAERRARGFTLIEVLVVVGLVSIMMALAVPSFRSFISNYRTTAAVNEFLQGVTTTRNEALKAGQRVLMIPNDSTGCPSFTGNWTNGWTVFVDSDRDSAYTGQLPLPCTSTSPTNAALRDVLVTRHAALPDTVATANANGTGQAFTDSISSKTYVSFDSTGYPRLLNGAVLSGGIQVRDTSASQPNWRTMCLAVFGRSRVVQGQVSCASG